MNDTNKNMNKIKEYSDSSMNYVNKEKSNKSNSQNSQESNSSQFSTASEDGQSLRENNINEIVKKGFKKITNYYNSNKIKKNNISLSCNYYCDILNGEENEYNLQIQIKDLINNYKENVCK